MAKASQVVLSENEFYLIKAPNGKVLEKELQHGERRCDPSVGLLSHPWQQWKFVDAGEGRFGASRTVLPAK